MNAFRPTAMVRLILLGFACSASLVLAQSSGTTTTTTATTTATTATTATPATASNPSGKLVGSFTALAGSTENASALVNGLRTGSAITLTDPRPQTGATTTGTTSTGTTSTTAVASSITFSPGTKPMGYGNIRIALSLARAQLASQGITNPTPAQLQGALVGTSGTTGTATQGILQMRASGMGWGQIANSMGVKLGAVMSGKQTTTTATTAAGDNVTAGTTGKVTTGSTASSVHGKSGVVTAAGGTGSGNSQVTTGLGLGGGHAAASGAVNAAGGRSGAGAGAGGGAGQGRGKP